MSSIRSVCLVILTLLLVSDTRGGQFASSASDYAEGTFATVGGQHYTDTNAGLGKPAPIVGEGTASPGILTPFNSHYEQDELVAIGRTGTITFRFAQPAHVLGTPQIGIFTSAALLDQDWPNGAAGATAMTTAMDEYGAERTAIVEVALNPNEFIPLGRFIFDDPSNYYANASGPYQFPAPDPAVLASFDQPFASVPSDFNNDNFAQVVGQLGGSAGGTWISIPLVLELEQIQYVRIRDPLWRMPDGTLVNERPSKYFPPPNEFIKPADLFIDGVVSIPEPGSIVAVGIALMLAIHRRAR